MNRIVEYFPAINFNLPLIICSFAKLYYKNKGVTHVTITNIAACPDGIVNYLSGNCRCNRCRAVQFSGILSVSNPEYQCSDK